MVVTALLALQIFSPDTLRIRTLRFHPGRQEVADSVRYGSPHLQVRTRQGTALIWMLRSRDTFFVAAVIPDSTPYWGDDFVLSIDTRGDGGSGPGHDDFQWYLRRMADSSVIFRGRDGRWQPPKGDPDWRLGPEREGGGWELSVGSGVSSWSLLLRLDPAWLAGADGRLPRLAIRIFDNDPHGWFAWPFPAGIPQASSVEQTPDLWAPFK